MVFKISPNQKPLFSVVIPTLNSAKTIRKSLESVFALNNSQGTIEVLIIDGASTDNTLDIAKEYKTRAITEVGKGRGFAYNRGFKESIGEYVAFLDSDAIAPKDWLKTGLKILERDPAIAVIHFKNIAPDDSTYFQKCVDTLLSKSWGQANGAIYRRSALATINGFNPSLPYLQEDEVKNELLKKDYKIKLVNEPLIFHYPRSNLKSFMGQCIESGIGAKKLATTSKHNNLIGNMLLTTIIALFPFLTILTLIFHTQIGLYVLFSGLLAAIFYSAKLWRSTFTKYRHAQYVFPALLLMWISKLANLIGYITNAKKQTNQ